MKNSAFSEQAGFPLRFRAGQAVSVSRKTTRADRSSIVSLRGTGSVRAMVNLESVADPQPDRWRYSTLCAAGGLKRNGDRHARTSIILYQRWRAQQGCASLGSGEDA